MSGPEGQATAGAIRKLPIEGERREVSEAARKRAAVELLARHEAALRRTARRFSICEDDAEDAYQRALEILLTKAPTDDLRELIRWTHTVTKHEALAVRRHRERLLGRPTPPGRDAESEEDWVQLIPSERDGPADQAERRERIARSREALQALKPQELRALTLLAEGYSYREIGEITGFSYTKINRCLAEGRERFRSIVARSEAGGRCEELLPLLSAHCDGELGEDDERALREHLRACAHCRSTLRAYRAAPRAASALIPGMPVARTLLERLQDALADLQSRLPGSGGEAAGASQAAAAGGAPGLGAAGVAKVVAACVGTAGGAAACVATGVVPGGLPGAGPELERPAIERRADLPVRKVFGESPPATEPEAAAPAPPAAAPSGQAEQAPADSRTAPVADPAPGPSVEFSPEAAVEGAPAPAPAPAPPAAPPPPATGGGGAAGEFGP